MRSEMRVSRRSGWSRRFRSSTNATTACRRGVVFERRRELKVAFAWNADKYDRELNRLSKLKITVYLIV